MQQTHFLPLCVCVSRFFGKHLREYRLPPPLRIPSSALLVLSGALSHAIPNEGTPFYFTFPPSAPAIVDVKLSFVGNLSLVGEGKGGAGGCFFPFVVRTHLIPPRPTPRFQPDTASIQLVVSPPAWICTKRLGWTSWRELPGWSPQQGIDPRR